VSSEVPHICAKLRDGKIVAWFLRPRFGECRLDGVVVLCKKEHSSVRVSLAPLKDVWPATMDILP
jgi:hypothetical protein